MRIKVTKILLISFISLQMCSEKMGNFLFHLREIEVILDNKGLWAQNNFFNM